MKRSWLVALAGLLFCPVLHAVMITGAGATFPYPLYAKWASEYKKQSGSSLNYQSIGSGGGIKQIQARTVDFGASDMPLKPDELAKNGLIQFPTVIGGVIPVINLPGVPAGQLRLSPAIIADIFLGRLKKWNDPRIAAINPGLKLPAFPISVIHRSDGSGTTFIFTNYLSKISPDWKSRAGEGTAVKWPIGVGGKGNEGVAAYVQRIKGSIGYVEYAYALQNKMNSVQLQNSAGHFVRGNAASFTASAANAKWDKTKGFYEILTNQPDKAAWPISGATFVLMQKQAKDARRTDEVLKFFEWAYARGDQIALGLDYIPMPDNVVKLIQTSWKESLKDSAGRPLRK
jgi:phosphate transport system substrate-binding protein